MAYITVTTSLDIVAPGDGRLSLREALTQANVSAGPDTIRFAATVVGKTLVLTHGELTITSDVIIDGNNGGAAAQTTLDADHASRVLRITGSGAEAKLNGLVVTNGRSHDENGGAVLVDGRASLTITNSTITRNSTADNDSFGANGGGIYVDAAAEMTMDHVDVSDNQAGGPYSLGGGIAAYDARVTIRNSTVRRNAGRFGGGARFFGGNIAIETSQFSDNHAISPSTQGRGGAISTEGSFITISGSNIMNNISRGIGGGISSVVSFAEIMDSTIANNQAAFPESDFFNSGEGGGLWASGYLALRNCTVTGNSAGETGLSASQGGGIRVLLGTFDLANSVVAGNSVIGGAPAGPDISAESIGGVIVSNGHNVFGSDVPGNIQGDREQIAARDLFAAVDPGTGGGKLGAGGTAALRNNVSNPALSAADPLSANAFDQRGVARPLPGGSLPDLGAAELNQRLSTAKSDNNDVLTGTKAANPLTGLPGTDYLKGLGGVDTLEGGPGGDLLDGGPGNDKLQGGLGLDLAAYPGAAAVVIDLSGTTDTARRGSEKDTLIGIEGALGSSGNDIFKGDKLNNEFQGGAGKDRMTGGGGRDRWDFNDIADSPAGATRDLVTDFAPGQDVIDLAGADADSTVPGNQSFRWVAKAKLTGAAQLGYFVSGGMTIVRASTDGDAAAELEIQLTGVKTLIEGDFRP